MYKVANYGLNILTPPLKPKFMSKYKKTIGPRNKAQSPFTYYLSIQPRKEEKCGRCRDRWDPRNR